MNEKNKDECKKTVISEDDFMKITFCQDEKNEIFIDVEYKWAKLEPVFEVKKTPN